MAVDAVLTCCRDEEDVIATFVLYYLDAGFDAVHVIDNGSIDGTVPLIEQMIDDGYPVTFERDDRLGYERYLTEWFRSAGRRLKPRWLFFLDCDEFICFPCHVREWLDGLPENVNHLTLRQLEVYPSPVATHFLLSEHCERSFNDTTKDVVRFHPEARVYGGKHRIDVPGARKLCVTDTFIRHYKYRSMPQAERKERNRMAAKRVYSDADLAEISATGVLPAREWIAYCERAAAEGRWRDSFHPAQFSRDTAMAKRAQSVLRRMSRHAYVARQPVVRQTAEE
jgi:hypothetical protein